eukprot:sb/3467746/
MFSWGNWPGVGLIFSSDLVLNLPGRSRDWLSANQRPIIPDSDLALNLPGLCLLVFLGIYHREEVEIWLAPARNYPLITQYGLELVAFLVCIDSKVPVGAKRGCLEAAKEDRYIAHLAEDLELTVSGQFYKASDFEAPKQQLTTNEWFSSKQQYQIGFVNLALSGQTRVYKITMLFKIKSPERTKRYAMVHEMVRRSNSEEEEGQSEAGEKEDMSVSVNLAVGGCPGNKEFVGVTPGVIPTHIWGHTLIAHQLRYFFSHTLTSSSLLLTHNLFFSGGNFRLPTLGC